MARVIKLVWRLDYDIAFGLINNRGGVLRTLLTEADQFWSGGPGPIPDSVTASFADSSEVRIISVEPRTCNGSVDWAVGPDLDRVLAQETFRSISRIVGKILSLCDIRLITRGGIRFIVVEQVPASPSRFREQFNVEVSNHYTRSAAKALGDIVDQAVVLEGKSEDGVGYKVMFGPTVEANIRSNMPLPLIHDMVELLGYQLYLDIDLFEHNFSFREHSLYGWAITKLDKAVSFVRDCLVAST